MEQQTFRLELLSPTFLGDAEQKAAWRTPPIKAQLRRWWRVAMFARGHRLPGLRQQEGELFGDATTDKDAGALCKEEEERIRQREEQQRQAKIASLPET